MAHGVFRSLGRIWLDEGPLPVAHGVFGSLGQPHGGHLMHEEWPGGVALQPQSRTAGG